MKTETIEWFTPQKRLPNDKEHVMCIFEGKWGVACYMKDHLEWLGWKTEFVPTYWASLPKGPQ